MRLVWSVSLLLLAIGGSQLDVDAQAPTTDTSARSLADSVVEDIRYLSSEELKGRGVDSDAIDVAAEFVAGRMRQIGLRTDVMNGSAFQDVAIPLGSQVGTLESNRIEFRFTSPAGNRAAAESKLIATAPADMMPMAIGSDRGTVSGPLAFVGYGITDKDRGYDDYAGLGVDGCVVMIIRKEPARYGNAAVTGGPTQNALFSAKIETAIQRGAVGVILVNDPGSIASATELVRRKTQLERSRIAELERQIAELPAEAVRNIEKLQSELERSKTAIEEADADIATAQRGVMELVTAGKRRAGKPSIPVVSVARDIVDKIFAQSGNSVSLTELERQINDRGAPKSFFVSGTLAKLSVELTPASRSSPNVIGVIEGSGDLASETVVIGAHYDHVGMGGYGSMAPGTIAVHNGADDNASGTAAMIQIAENVMTRLRGEGNHRRIVAIAFTGEERGLLGSRHYVRYPRYDLSDTVAMINLDMVGRLRDNELTVYGTASGEGLDQILEQSNSRVPTAGFELFKVETGYGPSDHQSFYESGVPVLFFFTGLHNDYHRPTDDFDKINLTGLARITDTVSDVVYDLAVRPERPRYIAADRTEPVRIRRQLTVRMGIRMADRDGYVQISDLVSDGSADRGGIQTGDHLVRIDDARIRSGENVLAALRDRSPGDTIRVELMRDGKPIRTTLRLDARGE